MIRLTQDEPIRTWYGFGGGDNLYKNLTGQDWDFDIQDLGAAGTTRYQG